MPGKVTAITSTKRTKDITRQTRAMEMRARGASWTEIAEECGYASPHRAYDAVLRISKRMPLEPANELRRRVLDGYLAGADLCWKRAEAGSETAIAEYRTFLDRVFTAAGLETPVPTVSGQPTLVNVTVDNREVSKSVTDLLMQRFTEAIGENGERNGDRRAIGEYNGQSATDESDGQRTIDVGEVVDDGPAEGVGDPGGSEGTSR